MYPDTPEFAHLWTTRPCRECGADTRCGISNTAPQCAACRDREITAMYAEGRYMGD